MASNNEMGITSAERWKGMGKGKGKRKGGLVGWAGGLSRWHCGCSLTETNSRALRPGTNNPGVHAVSVRALSVCECCMCALACIKRQTEVVRARVSMLGRPKCHTGNYTHLRSFQSAEISTMHF